MLGVFIIMKMLPSKFQTLGWALLFYCITISQGKNLLNDFIQHYEGLSYDVYSVERSHQRARRSLDNDVVRLRFHAHGRDFNLRLRPDTSTFTSDSELVFLDGQRESSLDTSHIYQGMVVGHSPSHVHGSLINGIFSGRIDIPGESFYVEKSELYFDEAQTFHSIIYSEEDVVDASKRRKRSHMGDEETGCGLSESNIRRWMKTVQNSAVKSSTPVADINSKRNGKDSGYHNKYSFGANADRRKRDTSSMQNRECSLFLQTDPMMWNYMTGTDKGSLGYSSSRARDEITGLLATLVDGIKLIYRNTTFKYSDAGPYTGFTFAVHRVQVNTSASCNDSNNVNPYCKPNIDVSNFLNLNSLRDQDAYCLAFMFTYRTFSQGTIGLAWVGSYQGAAGGVCERFKQYSDSNQYRSLNTGIVTIANYGSRVPLKVSILTFAHEVGHNFGSPHDSGPTCVPLSVNSRDPNGNFIMYASATSGTQPNNQRFSPCSIGNMTLVLSTVLNQNNGKINCFESYSQAFCGNQIVETDNVTGLAEQCDCGFSDDCVNEIKCCNPADAANSTQCTLKQGAVCSPSVGPCCSASCSFTPAANNHQCRSETECSFPTNCDGSQALCPKANKKADLLPCNFKTQVCKNGDCTGSICEKANWTVCYLTAPVGDKNFDRGQLCYVSCFNPKTGLCVSTGNQHDLQLDDNKRLMDLLTSINLTTKGIQMPAGAPCDNYQGYCDVFSKCREVNEDGPLALLKKLLFNEQTINEIRDWVTQYWWAVLLMGVGLVVIMALFIKLCAVHTPSSNPKMKKARQLTLPRRHSQPRPADRATISTISGSDDASRGGPPSHGKRKKHGQHTANTFI